MILSRPCRRGKDATAAKITVRKQISKLTMPKHRSRNNSANGIISGFKFRWIASGVARKFATRLLHKVYAKCDTFLSPR